MFRLFLLSVSSVFATDRPVFKVFGTDSYHTSPIFNQKFTAVRDRNGKPQFETFTSKASDLRGSSRIIDEKSPKIVWKRVWNGRERQLGWVMQRRDKLTGENVINFVSYSNVLTPVEAVDWLYLEIGEYTPEERRLYADHILFADGKGVKKSEAIKPGMLSDGLEFGIMPRVDPLQLSDMPLLPLLGCDAGWDMFDSRKCFKLYRSSARKPFAKRECFDQNARVLVIESETENEFFTQIGIDNGMDTIWLGVNDGIDDTVWVVDSATYSPWPKEVPRPPISYANFYANLVDEEKNSAFMLITGEFVGKWDIDTRTGMHSFICQKDATSGIVNFG